MTGDTAAEGTGLSPDEAFGLLGNETRVQILQELGEADEPLSFTELRDRLGIRQGGQFNYHLEKVVGHFVGKTDDGYALRQPGRRVVEAVLSGTVTDDPELEYTEIDEDCWLCGAPIGISFQQERLDLYCSACEGTYDEPGNRWPSPLPTRDRDVRADVDFHGTLFLPSAGVQDRTPEEAYRAALTWEMLDNLAVSSGICPRCSADVDRTVEVCEAHEDGPGLCEACGNLYAVHLHVGCENCVYRSQGAFVHTLYGKREMLSFLVTNGASPLAPDSDIHPFRVISWYDEEVHSVDPFEGRFTFTVDGETLTLTIDDEFTVVDATRS